MCHNTQTSAPHLPMPQNSKKSRKREATTMMRFPFWGIYECGYSQRDNEEKRCGFARAHSHDRSSEIPREGLSPSNLQNEGYRSNLTAKGKQKAV